MVEIDVNRVEKDIESILEDTKIWMPEKKLMLMAVDIRLKAGYYNKGYNNSKEK